MGGVQTLELGQFHRQGGEALNLTIRQFVQPRRRERADLLGLEVAELVWAELRYLKGLQRIQLHAAQASQNTLVDVADHRRMDGTYLGWDHLRQNHVDQGCLELADLSCGQTGSDVRGWCSQVIVCEVCGQSTGKCLGAEGSDLTFVQRRHVD